MSNAYRSLNIRHYRLVSAIAETGQLSVAADRLAITQPAASRTLKEIETALGQPVFERHPKGMMPTPVGEVFIGHAGAFLQTLAQAEEEFNAYGAGRTGTVRVGAVTGAAVGYVVPAIQKLGPTGADISVNVAPSVKLMQGLLNGAFDFVLSRVPPGTNAGRLEILGGRVEELRFLVRGGHPLLSRRGLRIGDLRDLVWVTQESGMPIRDALEHAFLAENLSPPDTFVNTPSFLFMTAYLKTSDAVTVVAREVADLLDTSRGGHLQPLDMERTIIMTPYHVIRERGRRMTPLAERLLGLVIEGTEAH